MTFLLVAPALVGVTLAVSAMTQAHRRLSPKLAVWILTIASAGAAIATAGAAGLLAVSLAGSVGASQWLDWCRRALPRHDRVPVVIAMTGAIALAWMGLKAARFEGRWRRSLRRWGKASGLDVIPVDEPVAYAVPGPSGRVVVSSGLLRRLDAEQRRALLAHEQAHVEHRHDRFLRLVGVCAAALPLLQPALAEVRFATERWADEVAAATVGSRRAVAVAIGKAAFASSAGSRMHLGGSDVAARVEALLCPPRRSRYLAALPAGPLVIGAAAGAGSAAVQLHHLVQYSLHVCSFA